MQSKGSQSKKLSDRFLSWAVREHHIWIVLLLFVAVMFLLTAGSRYAYTTYAKHTFLRPFYQHVAVAQRESAAIQLPHLVKKGTVSRAQGYTRRWNTVGDCLGVNYFTPHKSGNGLVCMKGFYAIYGLDTYDKPAFLAVNAYMLSHGYTLAQYDDLDLDIQEISAKDNLRGMAYVGADGTTVSATFVPRNETWDCNGFDFCRFSHSAQAQKYPGYVQITVEYSQTPY